MIPVEFRLEKVWSKIQQFLVLTWCLGLFLTSMIATLAVKLAAVYSLQRANLLTNPPDLSKDYQVLYWVSKISSLSKTPFIFDKGIILLLGTNFHFSMS